MLVCLYRLVGGAIDDSAPLSKLQFYIPRHNSRNRLLFSPRYSRTSRAANSPVNRRSAGYQIYLLTTSRPLLRAGCQTYLLTTSRPLLRAGYQTYLLTTSIPLLRAGCQTYLLTTSRSLLRAGCQDYLLTTSRPLLRAGYQTYLLTTSIPLLRAGCQTYLLTTSRPLLRTGCQDYLLTTSRPLLRAGCQDYLLTTSRPLLRAGCQNYLLTTSRPLLRAGCQDYLLTTSRPLLRAYGGTKDVDNGREDATLRRWHYTPHGLYLQASVKRLVTNLIVRRLANMTLLSPQPFSESGANVRARPGTCITSYFLLVAVQNLRRGRPNATQEPKISKIFRHKARKFTPLQQFVFYRNVCRNSVCLWVRPSPINSSSKPHSKTWPKYLISSISRFRG
ncbi:hypothetical protein J6590_086514 [Homalodisca vitripennis]|nr:hypothetical protein J6590_086514 [Homalodisca vitripennis]